MRRVLYALGDIWSFYDVWILLVNIYVAIHTDRRLSSRSLLPAGFPDGDTQCPSVILYPGDLPYPRPLPSFDLINHICDLCVFFLSTCLFVCPGMWCLTYSFPPLFVRLVACSLLDWWVSCFRAVCHCWKYAWAVDLPLQACPNVTIEDGAVLGECCPSGRDSSLNLFVFVFVSGAVSLSQIDEAFNVLDLSVVDVYWCVIFHHHLCLRFVHLQTIISTFLS